MLLIYHPYIRVDQEDKFDWVDIYQMLTVKIASASFPKRQSYAVSTTA
jgi:hypothetical protein